MSLRPNLLFLVLLAPSPLANAQDCNGNGVDDAIDLVLGTSLDCNQNGLPDECDTCSGDITLIDFEGFAELTPIGAQYASEGVTFGLLGDPALPIICTEGLPNVGFSGAGVDAPLAGLAALTDPDDNQEYDLEILFDPPVFDVSLFLIDIDASDEVEVRTYSGATLLATTGLAAGEEGTGNGFGSFLQLAGADVTRVEVEFLDGGQGWALDDLSFKRATGTTGCNSLLRVSQESAPGAGDFDAGLVGFVEVFETSSPVESLYSYDFPFSDSYNGSLISLGADDTNLVFKQTADEGLCLFVVHDKPDDGDGGRAEMRFTLAGDPDGAAIVAYDDPVGGDNDEFVGNPGENLFTARWSWSSCCTDGLVLGDLEDAFELILAFEDVNGSSSTPPIEGMFNWIVHSADGVQRELALEEGRRVRIDTVPGPCPLALEPDLVDLSLSAGGTQALSLDAGTENAFGLYFLLGSITGTQPGLNLGSVVLPLNPGPYFQLTLVEPNNALIAGQVGFLDAAGTATASLTVPPGTAATFAGLVVHHAFTLLSTPFVSNPCPARLVP